MLELEAIRLTATATKEIAVWTRFDALVGLVGAFFLFLAALFALRTYRAAQKQAEASERQAITSEEQRNLSEILHAQQMQALERQAAAAEAGLRVTREAAEKQIKAAEKQASFFELQIREAREAAKAESFSRALALRSRLSIPKVLVWKKGDQFAIDVKFRVEGEHPILNCNLAHEIHKIPDPDYARDELESMKLTFDLDHCLNFVGNEETNFIIKQDVTEREEGLLKAPSKWEIYLTLRWKDAVGWWVRQVMYLKFDEKDGDDLVFSDANLIKLNFYAPGEKAPKLIEHKIDAPKVTPVFENSRSKKRENCDAT